MKIANLATKKLNLLFGNEHENRERVFKEKYLDVWYSKMSKSWGLTLSDIEEFCRCCEKFDIKILGFETSYESNYGLNTYIYEIYCDDCCEGWWFDALADLQRDKITDSIIPYIHIPAEVLNNYIE